MFRNENAKTGSYSAYIGSVNYHGTYRRGLDGGKQEDLYKRIKKTVEKFPQNDAEVRYILSEIEKGEFSAEATDSFKWGYSESGARKRNESCFVAGTAVPSFFAGKR